jgi:hypothetical protein
LFIRLPPRVNHQHFRPTLFTNVGRSNGAQIWRILGHISGEFGTPFGQLSFEASRSVIPKVWSTDHLWSANPYTNKYFVLCGALKYFEWSANQKSLGTTDLGCNSQDKYKLLRHDFDTTSNCYTGDMIRTHDLSIQL